MKDQERNRFPIGQFKYGRRHSAKDVQRNIKVLERFPKELGRTLDRLRPQEYDLPYRQGGWTARQVVHHLADSHMNAYIRMKLAYTETGPRIKPYEEALWAETEDGRTGPIKPSLRILKGLHRRWTIFLESMNDDDFERGYYHPELHRTIQMSEAVALYAWHAQHHLAHIRLVVDAVESGQAQPSAAGTGKRRGRQPAVEAGAVASGAKNGRRRSAGAAPDGGEVKRRGLSPERMAEVRAVRMAKIAERKAAEAALGVTSGVAAAPKRRRRSKEEMERDRAAKAAAGGGEKKRRGLSPERMAEVRAVRMAKIAERKAAQTDVPPAEPRRRGRPKVERPAKQPSDRPKRPGRSAEHMEKIRAIRMARIAERKAGQQPPTVSAPVAENGTEKTPVRRGAAPAQRDTTRTKRTANVPAPAAEMNGEQPPATTRRPRKANATPVEVADQANPGQEIETRLPRTRGTGRGSKAGPADDAGTTGGPAKKGSKRKDKG